MLSEADYWVIQEILDETLGANVEDGAGEGVAADVGLLAQRYQRLRQHVRGLDAGELLTLPGADVVAAIEHEPYRGFLPRTRENGQT
jgi:hypothetical protein